MRIPLYKPYIEKDIFCFANESLDKGWLSYGDKANELEKYFIEKFGGWAVAVSSCTAALYLVAKLIKKYDDDEVLIPAITFVSTGMAFKSAGYKVIPIDVDDQGFICPDKIKKAINKKTRAVVIVHLYGQKYPYLNEVRQICDNNEIIMIEDCAHRIGFNDERRYGDYCCYSFNSMKELPSGEGGMICGVNSDDEKTVRELSYVGLTENTVQRTSNLKHSNYCFGDNTGLKYLQNDIIASLTLRLLDYYESNIEKRKIIFNSYSKMLEKYDDVTVFDREINDSFLMYVFRLKESYVDRFRKTFSDMGIATSHHYPSLNHHPLFDKRYECKNADSFEKEIITLPCYIDLHESEIKYICNAILSFFDNEYH